MSDIETGIRDVLQSLFSGFENDNIALYQELADIPAFKRAADAIDEGRIQDFFYALPYPLSNVVDGLLASRLPGSRNGQFLFKHSDFVKAHYQKLIEKFEGSCCCADKSRSILSVLLRHFLSGEEIVFNYDQEYTYHLPKTIFTTHQEIVSFFKAIQNLYYGNSDLYLKEIVAIHARMAALNSKEEPC